MRLSAHTHELIYLVIESHPKGWMVGIEEFESSRSFDQRILSPLRSACFAISPRCCAAYGGWRFVYATQKAV